MAHRHRRIAYPLSKNPNMQSSDGRAHAPTHHNVGGIMHSKVYARVGNGQYHEARQPQCKSAWTQQEYKHGDCTDEVGSVAAIKTESTAFVYLAVWSIYQMHQAMQGRLVTGAQSADPVFKQRRGNLVVDEYAGGNQKQEP